MATEQFKNAPIPSSPSTPWTTLNGAMAPGALSATVVDASVFSSAQFRIIIENDVYAVTAVVGNVLTLTVENGSNAGHASGIGVFQVVTAGAMLRNPRSMTTSGDMEYLNSGLAPARLGAPADGKYATTWASSVPSWVIAQEILTADPSSPANDTWWIVRDGTAPGSAAQLKLRIAGQTYVLAEITL